MIHQNKIAYLIETEQILPMHNQLEKTYKVILNVTQTQACYELKFHTTIDGKYTQWPRNIKLTKFHDSLTQWTSTSTARNVRKNFFEWKMMRPIIMDVLPLNLMNQNPRRAERTKFCNWFLNRSMPKLDYKYKSITPSENFPPSLIRNLSDPNGSSSIHSHPQKELIATTSS